jgi:transcriptional regulator with XRE-family HTH domain
MMTDKPLKYAPMARNDFGDKFMRLLELYRKPDGSKWLMSEIEEATKGFVKGPYLTNLKAGRIKQPGIERLRAIAGVMDFPPELWLQNHQAWKEVSQDGADAQSAATLKQKLNALFEVLTNERTGTPYTDEDVAAASGGELTQEQVGAARRGEIQDLMGAQYLALSNVFGVDINYWYQGVGEYPNLSEDDLRALTDSTTHLILNKAYGSSPRQKDVILHLLEQLELMGDEQSRGS